MPGADVALPLPVLALVEDMVVVVAVGAEAMAVEAAVVVAVEAVDYDFLCVMC